MQITSLMLTGKFHTDWFKIPLLGEAETAIRFCGNSWLCLPQIIPFWACCFFLTSSIGNSVSHPNGTANANSLRLKDSWGQLETKGQGSRSEVRGKSSVGEVGYEEKLKRFGSLSELTKIILLISSANSLFT